MMVLILWLTLINYLHIYDIYLVIYLMSCLPVSKIYGMLGGLLMSGMVIVEVMFS